MPASLLSSALAVVLEFFLHVFCYYFGRAVVPVLSLGRWKCDRLSAHVPRKNLRAAGVYHRRDGRVYLTVEDTYFVGFAALVVAIGAGILIWVWRTG